MKILSISILIFLGCMFFGVTLSCAKESTEGYLPDEVYPGFYVNDRVYVENRVTHLWYPDSYKRINSFNCQRARLDLASLGIWVGNLDNQGRCDGDDEAAQRALGNYLNYLHSVGSAATRTQE